MKVKNLVANNVKNGVNAQAASKLAGAQKAEKSKLTEAVALVQQPSFSRTLEAYSDCV